MKHLLAVAALLALLPLAAPVSAAGPGQPLVAAAAAPAAEAVAGAKKKKKRSAPAGQRARKPKKAPPKA